MRHPILSIVLFLTLAACNSPPPAPPPSPVERPAPATAHFEHFVYAGHDPVYDSVKARPEQYLNPILPGFYPDPSIVRVGDDYYLVNSTFAFFPGLPIFHSRDLVHWTQIGNAVDRPSQAEFGTLGISRGLFAPAITYHDGTFAIVNTCVDCKEDNRENFLITATNPAGPWSDPIELGFEGIDPSLFFDRRGKTYIVNNGPPEGTPLYEGHRAIWMQELDWATRKLIGPRRVLVNGGADIRRKPIWIEGPHLFRVGGWYYLMCAEGGTADQHSEVIFRSRKVWGPYVPYKGNPILTQRDLDPSRPFPITSTGHAQLVKTQKGQWFSVFLGTRPYADDEYNTGRETFLLPVTWKHGWPVILPKGRPVPYAVRRPKLPVDASPVQSGNFISEDAFGSASLAPQWLMIRTPHEKWYSLSNGALDIRGRPEAIGGTSQPSFVGRRQQHGWADISVDMRFSPNVEGERAGLVAFQNSEFFYFFGVVREAGKTQLCVTKRAGATDPDQGAVLSCTPIAPSAEGMLHLKIAVRGPAYDFYYGSAPNEWKTLVRDADGTILSTRKAGGFVGTVVGMYAFSPR